VTAPLDLLLLFVALCPFVLLGSNRIDFGVRLLAAQGIALGAVVLMTSEWEVRRIVLAVGGAIVKGLVLPWLLNRTIRDVGVRQETRPKVGYALSLLIGVALLGVSFVIANRLHLPRKPLSPLELPVALFCVASGLFLIVGRTTALCQLLGYLVMDNGLFLAGMLLAHDEPLLVEMGVLMDLLVAVLVMGVAIFHIRRTFDTIDVDKLSSLRD
jgi:hydrogenase-4 component E